MKFPTESLPNRNNLIKRKLWQGLPSTVQGRIESFLDDEYPLFQFVERVEHERDFLLEAQHPTVCSIPEKEAESTPKSDPKPPLSNQQFEELQQQLDNLSQRMAQTTKPPRKYSCTPCRTNSHSRSPCLKQYCAYCRKSTHSLRNCSHKPPVRACFDCKRPNCRRGKPGCPGKSATDAWLCVRTSSPVISVAVNGKILRAMVDTGSERTLIRRPAVDRIEDEINHRKNLPNLQGVTGDPLRILGMSWTEIGIGDKKLSKQYLPVVPNTYLGTDLILGCDILGQATMTWYHPKQLFVWGDTPYVVNFVRKHRRQSRK